MKWSVFAVVLLCLPQFASAESKFEFKEISPTGLQLSEGGTPVFVYNFGPVLQPGFPEAMARSCYMHPVFAPDGTLLTDDFNKNHPHHRGIFWAWMDISVGGKQGDIWTLKGDFRDRFVAWKAKDVDADSAHLAVDNGWFDGDKKFVTENVDIVTHAAKDNQRVMDFTLSFEAIDQPVRIKGTSEDNKWYGGFAFRFAPRDGGEAKTTILTDEGNLKKDGVMSPHPWTELTGIIQGKPEGGRVDDDPSNPGYPKNGWLLRHGFGLLNICYPGPVAVTMEPGKPLVLKYRVTLFSGDAVPKQ
jgi:Methane oxygenase PmoA